jgi:hypothetical protein
MADISADKISPISPAFAQAFIDAQGSIEGAIKGKKNPGFQNSKYADLRSCWEACKESLQENKIGVLQFPCQPALPGHIGMLTILVYGPSGEAIGTQADFPLKDPTNAQAAGSAITYARRYALCSVIGICPEDDDGNAASAVSKNRGNSNKAIGEEPKSTPSHDGAWYRSHFDSDAGSLGRKCIYAGLKSEPDFKGKSELLAYMVDGIKESLAKEAGLVVKESL